MLRTGASIAFRAAQPSQGSSRRNVPFHAAVAVPQSRCCAASRTPLGGFVPLLTLHHRSFSSIGSGMTDRHSVEGRYAYALFGAAKGAKALDQVHADVQGLQEALEASSDFKAFAMTCGITGNLKVAVVQQMADRFKFHKITSNFLSTVAENKRMPILAKTLAAFDDLYRASRGEIRCYVTSAKELSTTQQKQVIEALQKRAGTKAKILTDFNLSPSVTGGLLVRMGEEVLDYTVVTRLESLRLQLAAPLNA